MSTTIIDLEKGENRKEYQVGFADFSEYIASDRELSLYKSFASLTARNLLYLKAELQVLEKELRSMDEEAQSDFKNSQDAQEKMAIEAASRAWEGITRQCEAGNEHEMRRMNLILRIRKLVKEYEKALLCRNQILSLAPPDHGTQSAFLSWFCHKKPFQGSGWHLLDNEKDIIALKTKPDPDRLTSIIQYCFGYYLQERQHDQPGSWGPMYYFKESVIAWIVGVIAVAIAAFFLKGGILVLYYVERMGARLGILSALTTAFAGTVGLLTNAKRAEVFAATAAYVAHSVPCFCDYVVVADWYLYYTYAAVLVVSVSGNISSS